MTQEAYDEVHKNLLMKKIDGIFEGFKGIASLGGDIVIFRHPDHLAFRICGDMLISVPYDDISDIKEIEPVVLEGKSILVTTKSGYEYCINV